MNSTITIKKLSDDLTVIQVNGALSSDQARATIQEFYAGDPTNNLIWDLRQADAASFTTENIQSLIRFAKGLSGPRQDGRSALVVQENLEFGLSRMYQTWAELEKHPIPHGVFRSLEEALVWIEGEED